MLKSEKLWLLDIYRRNGFQEESDVTRTEFQLRRQFLKEYGANTYAEMIQVLPDMWRYLSHDWLDIRLPNEKDSNHRRWPTLPLWEVVQSAGDRFGECLGVERWKQKQAKIEPLMAQMKGIMASIVAIDSTIRGEHFAIPRLKSEISTYLESEEFHGKVLERRGKYGSMSN